MSDSSSRKPPANNECQKGIGECRKVVANTFIYIISDIVDPENCGGYNEISEP